MAEMRHPHLRSVIDVREGSVKRYAEAGYVEVKRESSEEGAAKKSTRKSTKK